MKINRDKIGIWCVGIFLILFAAFTIGLGMYSLHLQEQEWLHLQKQELLEAFGDAGR